ncbi:Uncharacterized protein CLAVI_000521 [Candidatus Clavichlamydia salmonicola]|uniref:phospholipase D-like domain-containing protein n=1 Tax=Candidatus Clavichlamydia salmonicola TaxID=469812 RepID=UPI00189198A5|nr:phosphatidylserine/phosphatidylglycerophosphate/cardiolipin synthase family protein [Candidatus Clavichlamydia salmonicola]MBF5050899.1 Uncharacterized protein [Candidatus Clavichlamydia salmonicola]
MNKKGYTFFLGMLLTMSFLSFNIAFGEEKKEDKVAVLVCQNSMEMYDQVCSLVSKAEVRIDMALCFTGGEYFRNLLSIVEKRMTENLKVSCFILYDLILMNPEDKEKLQLLEEKFSNRLESVISDSAAMPFPSMNVYRSHVKMIIVDGKYCAFGGTNIEDRGCSEGSYTPLHMNLETTEALNLCERPLGNRDQDIVCRGPISQLLSETFHLYFAQWKKYASTRFFQKDPEDQIKNTLFTTIPLENACSDDHFDQRSDLIAVESSKLKVLFGGPHQVWIKNPIHQEYIKLINEADSSIRIASLFFMPNAVLKEALMAAANRGVRIEIITNGCDQGSAGINQFFSWGNRIAYFPMFYGKGFNLWQKATVKGISPLPNVFIFEYAVPFVELHKKVMIIDQKILAIGSYNIAQRSYSYDYEICAFIDSPGVAANALKIFEQDKTLSRPISSQQSYEWYFDAVIRGKGIVQMRYN